MDTCRHCLIELFVYLEGGGNCQMASPTQLAAKPLETATPVKPTHNNIPTEQQQPRLSLPALPELFLRPGSSGATRRNGAQRQHRGSKIENRKLSEQN